MSKTPLSRPTPRLGTLAGLAFALPALLSAQTTLYWGGGTIDNPETSVDVSSTSFESPYNGGFWNNTLLNWNSSTSATTGWQAWEAGALAVIKSNKPNGNAYTTITLTEDITVGGISLEHGTPGNTNQGYIIGGAQTITLNEGAVIANDSTVTSSTLTFSGNTILAGSHGFTSSGHVTINSASTVSGQVNIAARPLTLGATGSLLNIDSFDIARGARLSFSNTASGNGSDSIKDTATVTLRNSALYFTTAGSATGTSETLGKIVLEGSGYVNVVSGRTLTLADGLDRGANGKGVLSTSIGTATGFGSGTNIVLGNTASSVLLPYAINVSGTNDVRFLSVDANGVLQAVAVETAPTNSAWTYNDPAKHLQVIVGAATTLSTFTSDVTIGTLALGNTASGANINLNFGGNTLTTQAVALAVNGDRSSTLALGANSSDKITSSTGDLYLIHERNNNSALLGQINVNASVVDSGSTPVSLILGGATGNFVLNGTNTHTGKTYVNAWSVTLGSAGRLLSTSELNISRSSTFINTGSDAGNVWGGGSIDQKLSGGGTYQANTRNVVIGTRGTLAPGSFGAGETLNFAFTTGKLQFDAGSTVALTLGTLSDSIAFTTAGDWLSGSNNFILDLSTGAGFEGGVAYSIFKNVTTTGFAPGSVTLDGVALVPGDDYTWHFEDNTYYFTYTGLIPEPAAAALLLGFGALGFVALRRSRRSV